jgi:predicted TIM-barrel fold metal-dependent hydrolase
MAVAGQTVSSKAEAGSDRVVATVDACVFHEWFSSSDLAPYLRKGWRELLTSVPARSAGPMPLYINPMGSKFEAAFPTDGTVGVPFESFKEQVLDAWSPDRVVLGYDESILMTASANVYAAAEIIRATNEWTAEAWLPRDDRLYGLILVSGARADLAAREIRRLGRNERMVGVAVGANVLNLTFGHPAYHPIYKAASELGLPVVLQVGSDLAASLLTPPVAGGQAAMYGEYDALNSHALMSHVAGMIVQGVFELFPDLKVLLVGGGVTWVPGYLWRLDYAYKFAHQSAPWLKRMPSEYFKDSISVSTYQLERSLSDKALESVLETAPWLRANLIYASGYPNRDALDPGAVRSRLPASWADAALAGNALEFFRWP